VGFRITDRGIARHGFSVLDENLQSIGVVTSATYLADKKMAIGFAYVAIDKARKDTATSYRYSRTANFCGCLLDTISFWHSDLSRTMR
jgi:glycine cleavage system aminomethyltransferase T